MFCEHFSTNLKANFFSFWAGSLFANLASSETFQQFFALFCLLGMNFLGIFDFVESWIKSSYLLYNYLLLLIISNLFQSRIGCKNLKLFTLQKSINIQSSNSRYCLLFQRKLSLADLIWICGLEVFTKPHSLLEVLCVFETLISMEFLLKTFHFNVLSVTCLKTFHLVSFHPWVEELQPIFHTHHNAS